MAMYFTYRVYNDNIRLKLNKIPGAYTALEKREFEME